MEIEGKSGWFFSLDQVKEWLFRHKILCVDKEKTKNQRHLINLKPLQPNAFVSYTMFERQLF